MELKIEFPTLPSNSVKTEFHEKVAIPFNRVFSECKNEFTREPAFQFMPITGDDPRIAILSLTKLLEPPVGRSIFPPRVILSFYPNDAVFKSDIKEYDGKKGIWSEMMQIARSFIRSELELYMARYEEVEKISETILALDILAD